MQYMTVNELHYITLHVHSGEGRRLALFVARHTAMAVTVTKTAKSTTAPTTTEGRTGDGDGNNGDGDRDKRT